jgi:rare lipoprotein A
MRLPADGRSARFVRLAAGVIPALALGACGLGGDAGPAAGLATASAPTYGPQGDYPVVVGDPYTVAGTAYTPEDLLNYDHVGFLAADQAGGNGVSGSHHTLPLPSYVEVTSLETGRTILVRLERRGPMNSNELLALSPGALAQLAGGAGTPVRVRRVNPPEDQRALLRAGSPAEPRMDTPMSLVEILKRKLPGQSGVAVSVAQAPPVQTATRSESPATVATSEPAPQASRTSGAPALPPLESRRAADPAPVPVTVARTAPIPAPTGQPVASRGAFVVQAAAFSTADRARRAASALDGEVSQAGQYFRVRTGPFATRGEAEASLAKVRAAGYSDARILTNG